MEVDKNNVETVTNQWMTTLIPYGGGRLHGKLLITNQRILFLANLQRKQHLYKYRENVYLNEKPMGECIEIVPNEIKKVDTKDCFMNKKVVVELKNGVIHVIDHGGASTKRLVEEIVKLVAS